MTLKFASFAGPAAVSAISHGPGTTFCNSAESTLNARTRRVSTTCSTSDSAATTGADTKSSPKLIASEKPQRIFTATSEQMPTLHVEHHASLRTSPQRTCQSPKANQKKMTQQSHS